GREAEHSRYGGTRERVGWALEALARGLLAADQADEAVKFATQSLAVHELEYGGLTDRAHELRRLLFAAQVHAQLHDDAFRTEKLLLNGHGEDWPEFVTEALWMSQVYLDTGMRVHAEEILVHARQKADAHGLDQLTREVEARLLELASTDVISPPQDRDRKSV